MTTTEPSTDSLTQSIRALTDPFGMLSIAPQLDLIQGIELFFNIAQRTIDVNREFAGRWAELVGSLTAVILEQAEPDDQLSTEDVVHTGNDGRRGGIDTVIDDPAPVDAR